MRPKEQKHGVQISFSRVAPERLPSRIRVHREEFVKKTVIARPAGAPIDGFNVACAVVVVLCAVIVTPEVLKLIGKVTAKCVTIPIGRRNRIDLLRDLLETVSDGDAVIENDDRILVLKHFRFGFAKPFSQISRFRLWGTDPGVEFLDLLEKLKRNDIESARAHPTFWSYSERLGFLNRLADVLTSTTDHETALRLEARKSAIFDTDWQDSFKKDKKTHAFIREEVARHRLSGETRSLKSLVLFIRRKMRHVCETASSAGLSLTAAARLDEAVFEFVTSPFPRLFLETSSAIN
jgi:hypothetical protein